MSQSLANILVHAIWSTKDRKPTILDEVRGGLHGYMAGILQNLECLALTINSVSDHVHVLCQLSKNLAPCKMVENVKKNSTKWMKLHGVPSFAWQTGYGIFSVSQSTVPAVRKYIERQPVHHKETDFKEEFRAFCERYNLAIDERYVWD